MNNNNLVESHKIPGNRVINIYVDTDSESPDSWEDPAVKMVTTCNRYFEHLEDDVTVDQVGQDSVIQRNGLRVFDLNGVMWRVYPLWMYAHSGVALAIGVNNPFHCPWDSGQVGFILVNPKELRNNRQTTSLKAAESNVEVWNMYLSGDVYGYVIEQPQDCEACDCADPTAQVGLANECDCACHGDDVEPEVKELDSCWGFYGLEAVKEAAIEACGESEVTK